VVFSPFFFQAEDGIRVRNVTGVQTCALPILAISQRRGLGGRWWRPLSCYGSVTDEAAVLLQNTGMTDFADQPVGTLAYGQQRLEIGRASCRGREMTVSVG